MHVHERRRPSHPLSALRRRNGNARSGSGNALDARPVLGLSDLRPPFLVDLSATKERRTQAGGSRTARRAARAPSHRLIALMPRLAGDDEPLEDDEDEDEDDDEPGPRPNRDDDDEDDENDGEDWDDEDEEEPWQVLHTPAI